MNLDEMRAIVRRDLHDEDDANYRWSDDELDRHIAHAVKDYSEACPLEQKVNLATTAGTREIDLSGLLNRVHIEAVEYPVGDYPPRYQRFSLWGDKLTLLGDSIPDGSDAAIIYGALHTLSENQSTIPAWQEELVAGAAAGYAASELAVYAVDRVNIGGNQTAVELANWGNEKLAFFRRELKRLGRKNRVRARALYTALTLPVNLTKNPGP